MNIKRLLISLLATCFFASQAMALDVLIADDYHGSSNLDQLDALIPNHTLTHSDNSDSSNDPVLTIDLAALTPYDVVIFYASGHDNSGRKITQAEFDILTQYIEGGGHLIVTGYDTLGSPSDLLLADLVRSRTTGDDASSSDEGWKVTSENHPIVNGPNGDFRGQSLTTANSDHDDATADASQNSVSLGALIDPDYYQGDKVIYTPSIGAGGSVGYWTGNSYGNDWIPSEHTDGDKALAILRNWLDAYTVDSDGDSTPDVADLCAADPNKSNPGVCGCGSSDADLDGDGKAACEEDCPADANKVAPGACGCGLADTDSDGDGWPECFDLCPGDTSKVAPGFCGCGKTDGDDDKDGIPNCFEQCPADPAKVFAGLCGCGVADTDANGNGVADCDANGELKAILNAAKTAVNKLNKKKKSTKKEAKNLMKKVVAYVNATLGSLSVLDASVDLPGLTNTANKAVKKAARFKKSFKKDKKKAKNALADLEGGLAS